MKQKVLTCLIAIILFLAVWIPTVNAGDIAITIIDPQAEGNSTENIYREIVYTFLEPHIYEVLADYYQVPSNYEGCDIKVINIERPKGGGSYYFVVTIEVHVYTGPYDRIGIDKIVLETAGGGLRALKYEHTDGFDFHRDEQKQEAPEGVVQWPENISDRRVYYDLAMLLLSPAIDQAIMSYYGCYFTTDPWANRVLQITEQKEKGKPIYIIRVEVIPYTGPHNSVGIDYITLSIDDGPSVNIDRFEHLKSYQLSMRQIAERKKTLKGE